MLTGQEEEEEEEEDDERYEFRVSCTNQGVRGGIQNIPDWCRHLYSSCGSAKHWSQQAKL
jgi:hypothetical protein